MPMLRVLAAALPVAFAAHVVEEAPGFVDWINAEAQVRPPITQESFVSVNVGAFVITLVVSLLLATSREVVAGLIGCAWVSFLMLANGLVHLAGTVVHGSYCPGVVTGTLIYLPVGLLLLRAVKRELQAPAGAVAAAAVLGAIPMLVHGYRIVFLGSRLF